MAAVPCSIKIDCDCSDFPITNYSSEAAEQQPTYYALTFPSSTSPTWSSRGCLSLCTSTESQLEADLCALAQEASCTETNQTNDGGSGGGGGDPFVITTPTTNDFQYCSVPCGDGTSYTIYVPAGTFSATTKAAANAQASAYACAKARITRICIGDASQSDFCKDVLASATISVAGTSIGTRQIWTLVSGSVPTGMSLYVISSSGSPTALVSTGTSYAAYVLLAGTPTSAGSYTFTLKAATVGGSYMTRSFTICVVAITPDSLPDGDTSTAYSQFLSATSCASSPLSWQITAGALPDGLALNESTGEISGTPTAEGDFTFTITVQTEAT